MDEPVISVQGPSAQSVLNARAGPQTRAVVHAALQLHPRPPMRETGIWVRRKGAETSWRHLRFLIRGLLER